MTAILVSRVRYETSLAHSSCNEHLLTTITVNNLDGQTKNLVVGSLTIFDSSITNTRVGILTGKATAAEYVVLESFVVPLRNVSCAAHETLPESEIILTQWSIGACKH